MTLIWERSNRRKRQQADAQSGENRLAGSVNIINPNPSSHINDMTTVV